MVHTTKTLYQMLVIFFLIRYRSKFFLKVSSLPSSSNITPEALLNFILLIKDWTTSVTTSKLSIVKCIFHVTSEKFRDNFDFLLLKVLSIVRTPTSLDSASRSSPCLNHSPMFKKSHAKCLIHIFHDW